MSDNRGRKRPLAGNISSALSNKKGSSGVDYSLVSSRHIDDDRYERGKTNKGHATAGAGSAAGSNSLDLTAKSSTMDSVMRIMTGQSERGIKDKINDSNRPTWEQYKVDNRDKLELEGSGKDMANYREMLDKEREDRLKGRKSAKEGGE